MHISPAEGQGTTAGRDDSPLGLAKQAVRAMVDQVWHEGNLSFIRTAFSPAFVGRGPVRTCRDLSSYRLHVAEVRAAFPDIRFDIVEQIEEHGSVVSRYRMRGTHLREFWGVAPTAQRVTTEGMAIHRITGGRIEEAWSCWDVIGLLRALGVTVPPLRVVPAAGAV